MSHHPPRPAEDRRPLGGSDARPPTVFSAAIPVSALYTPLPASLGGSASAGPASTSPPVSQLLPAVRGVPVPSDDALHVRVRNRTLLLEKGGPSAPAPSPSPRRRRGGTASALRKRACRRRAESFRGGLAAQIPAAERAFALYEPLRTLWDGYAQHVLGAAGDGAAGLVECGERVARMDLHGAFVEVVRARDPGLVGVAGILIVETMHAVLVVCRDDRVVTVPKMAAVVKVFVAGVPRFRIVLPLLPFRASERSARKMKKNV